MNYELDMGVCYMIVLPLLVFVVDNQPWKTRVTRAKICRREKMWTRFKVEKKCRRDLISRKRYYI